MTKYELVIGLEVHTQLKTNTKIFCSCSTEFGQEPNSNICPGCSAQPGALPVLNKKVVELALRFGLALGCKINHKSLFARKNYFYPDLAKGYQISQLDLPIVGPGKISVVLDDGTIKEIGINRAHLEEDAGKLVHQGAEGILGSHSSHSDLNRSSMPLLEIVSEPDLRSAEEARKYLEKIKAILQFAGISDANMEEGKLRCDANISLRPVGQKEYGKKTEVKNMNSFKAVERAIKSEAKRQERILKEGGIILQETRTWDDLSGETTPLRSKEEANDYRYFPDPDLPLLIVTAEWIDKIRAEMPELPDQRLARYKDKYNISDYDASVLTLTKEISDFFDKCLTLYTGDNKKIINWLTTEVLGYLKDKNLSLEQSKITPQLLVEMIKLIDDNVISGKIGKAVVSKIMETGKSPIVLVAELGLKQIDDRGELKAVIEKILQENPAQVEQYKAGKITLKGFFVGQVMKITGGKANPAMVNQLLAELLA